MHVPGLMAVWKHLHGMWRAPTRGLPPHNTPCTSQRIRGDESADRPYSWPPYSWPFMYPLYIVLVWNKLHSVYCSFPDYISLYRSSTVWRKQANGKRTIAIVEGEKTAAEPTHYVTRLSQAPLLPEDPFVGKNQTHRVPTPAPFFYTKEGR